MEEEHSDYETNDYETNDFEREINDLREWQENQYNPGYYIGTGRVPRPISRLNKYPIFLIIIGAIWIIPVILSFIASGLPQPEELPSLFFSSVVPLAFIIGGVIRLRKPESRKGERHE